MEQVSTNSVRITERQTFHKNWYLKVNDPLAQRALWLRFSLLSSRNGFKRLAEVWAVFFQKNENREIKKIALKQTFDIQSFSDLGNSGIKIGSSELLTDKTAGSIQSKGNLFQWDFSFLPARESSFNHVPEILSRTGISRSSIITDCQELLFSGVSQFNGEVFTWKESPGMRGRFHGSRIGHSWVWGHCNTFLDDQGNPSSFVFEGLSNRVKLGPVTSPHFSTFFFHYRGKDFYFNRFLHSVFIKSRATLNEWEFQVDQDDLSFRGRLTAEYKDFAGLTYEDTNGSLLYSANSKLSQMTVHVYRGGKLEASFYSQDSAGFEIVSRDKNPYVSIVI